MPDQDGASESGSGVDSPNAAGQAWDAAIRTAMRRHRVDRGWSLREVAERSRGKLKPATLGAYERGDRQMTLPVLRDLADIYGVPVTSFMPNDQASRTSAADVLRAVGRLPDRHRSLVAELVEELQRGSRTDSGPGPQA